MACDPIYDLLYLLGKRVCPTSTFLYSKQRNQWADSAKDLVYLFPIVLEGNDNQYVQGL